MLVNWRNVTTIATTTSTTAGLSTTNTASNATTIATLSTTTALATTTPSATILTPTTSTTQSTSLPSSTTTTSQTSTTQSPTTTTKASPTTQSQTTTTTSSTTTLSPTTSITQSTWLPSLTTTTIPSPASQASTTTVTSPTTSLTPTTSTAQSMSSLSSTTTTTPSSTTQSPTTTIQSTTNNLPVTTTTSSTTAQLPVTTTTSSTTTKLPVTTTTSSTTTQLPATTTTSSTTAQLPATTTFSSTTTQLPATTTAPSTTTQLPATTTTSSTTAQLPATTTSSSTTTKLPATTTASSTTTQLPATTTTSSTTAQVPATTTIPSTTTQSTLLPSSTTTTSSSPTIQSPTITTTSTTTLSPTTSTTQSTSLLSLTTTTLPSSTTQSPTTTTVQSPTTTTTPSTTTFSPTTSATQSTSLLSSITTIAQSSTTQSPTTSATSAATTLSPTTSTTQSASLPSSTTSTIQSPTSQSPTTTSTSSTTIPSQTTNSMQSIMTQSTTQSTTTMTTTSIPQSNVTPLSSTTSLPITSGELTSSSTQSTMTTPSTTESPTSQLTTTVGVVQNLQNNLQEDFTNYTATEANDFANKTVSTLFGTILDRNVVKNATEAQALVDSVENTLVSMLDAVLNSTNSSSGQITNDFLSITVVKTSGDELNANYSTDYGTFSLPEWGTFKDKLEQDKISIQFISYAKNPYAFAANSEDINSAILTIRAINNKQEEIHLEDPDDPASLGIDSSSVLNNQSTWNNMERLNSYARGFSFVTTFKRNTKILLIEIYLEGETCGIYGKYGNILPDERDHEVKVIVQDGTVSEIDPKKTNVFLNNGLIQIVLTNPWFNDYDHNITVLVNCPEGKSRLKRSSGNSNIQSGYRASTVNVKVLDKQSHSWTSSNSLQVDSVKGNNVHFKTTFFNTFALSVFFIPPTPIDFQAIFSNFAERFAQTPHVFVTDCVLIVIFILVTILLRRLDRKDSDLWEYAPLIDNPVKGCREYYLAVYTGVRSSREFTSTAFINIIGSTGQTGTRVLMDDVRENFKPGTLSCFYLITDHCIGTLKEIKVWHNNVGKSPRWLLDKIIIIDKQRQKRYVFHCGKWLSLDSEDGQIWQRLFARTKDMEENESLFSETCKFRLFDDHLWLSVYKRPNFSRFTRVQRLWTLVSLLFLAMITSAMWYNADDTYSRNAVSLGPFTLSYKEFYVGLVSSVIAVVPSLIIVAIFKYRRFKDEVLEENKAIWIDDEKKSRCFIPWWFIFIAYGLIVLVITVCGTFTFLYSLDWGPNITLEWMLSFILGISQGMFLIEPLKVVIFAFILACICSKTTTKANSEVAPLQNVKKTSTVVYQYESKYNIEKIDCPDLYSSSDSLDELRRRLQLDKRLHSLFIVFIRGIIYVTMLCLMVSHNKVSESYLEKNYIGSFVNSGVKPDTIKDIWTWLEDSFAKKVFPKRWYNDDLRSAYVQRFIDNGWSYRLGMARLRQVRVQGQCNVPETMKSAVKICPPSFDSANEERSHFCQGWLSDNITCINDENRIDKSFTYSSSDGDLSTYGLYAYYGGGGYRIDVGHQQSVVSSYLQSLKSLAWVDHQTRALFVEFNVFNPSTKLHGHFKITFELSPFGDINTESDVWASNLYPYMGPWDYIILVIQLLYVIYVLVRIVIFFVSVYKLRTKCCSESHIWIEALRLIFCIFAIALFILRIDSTISAIEKLNNNPDSFVPLEKVHIFDEMYRMCLSAEVFLAILDLLKALTFNYYLHLMKSSLVISLGQISATAIILAIIIVAFSTILYIFVGPLTFEFRDMPTSMLSLTRLSLTIAKFKNTLKEVDSIFIEAVFMAYMILVTFIMINFFIAILTHMFGVMKSDQQSVDNVEGFDVELNEHFWWRIEKLASRISEFFCIRNKTDSENNNYIQVTRFTDIFEEKFLAMDKLILDENEDEARWARFLIKSSMTLLTNPEKRNYLSLQMNIENGYTNYTFRRKNGTIVLVFKIPYGINPGAAIPIKCIDVSEEIDGRFCPFEDKNDTRKIFEVKKGSVKTVQDTIICELYEIRHDLLQYGTDIVASFNHGRTWEFFTGKDDTCNFNEQNKSYVTATLDALPTHVTVTYYTDFELFTVTPDGAVLSPSFDGDIQLSFGKGCFEHECNVRLKVQSFSDVIQCSLLLSETLLIPISVRLLCKDNSSAKTSEFSDDYVVLQKEHGCSKWFIVNTYIQKEDSYITFKLPVEVTEKCITVSVKKSEMRWIRSGLNQTVAVKRKIMYLASRYKVVALRWRSIAEAIGLTNDCINVIDSVSTRSEEEKCFLVFTHWCKIKPNVDVKDVIKIIKLEGFETIAGGLENCVRSNYTTTHL